LDSPSYACLLERYRLAPNAKAAQTFSRGIILIIMHIMESETSNRRIDNKYIRLTFQVKKSLYRQ
jgi:hypothetical protein